MSQQVSLVIWRQEGDEMSKCARCSVSLGLLSLRSHCDDCQEVLRSEQLVKLAQVQEAERRHREQEEIDRRSAAMTTAKALKRRILAGEPVYLYENVYLDVNSRVVDESVCRQFSIEPLCKLGLEGWEVMGIVPRTVGIALTNRSFGSSSGETWGAGVGGNIVGVYVLLRLVATPTSCSDRILFDYVFRHLDAVSASTEAWRDKE